MISDIEASAQNQKRSEAYFMTRAERAARVSCSKEKTPKRTSSCRKKQMAAARRVVSYIKGGNRERRLKRTLGCLQKVQVLPVRLRRRGMLWVERCAKR
ncbi:MAG: hypothetical protein GY948_25155 [Alphaproteobacteria bacterium]|nr:hypothetical protein [Alphaproteobacteria bacterium]